MAVEDPDAPLLCVAITPPNAVLPSFVKISRGASYSAPSQMLLVQGKKNRLSKGKPWCLPSLPLFGPWSNLMSMESGWRMHCYIKPLHRSDFQRGYSMFCSYLKHSLFFIFCFDTALFFALLVHYWPHRFSRQGSSLHRKLLEAFYRSCGAKWAMSKNPLPMKNFPSCGVFIIFYFWVVEWLAVF